MNYRRNIMAKQRTLMANERTLMSYYRSALALLGLAAFVFRFYDPVLFKILAGIFLVLALVLIIYGTIRFRLFHKKIIKE